jgi:hypothetical protein
MGRTARQDRRRASPWTDQCADTSSTGTAPARPPTGPTQGTETEHQQTRRTQRADVPESSAGHIHQVMACDIVATAALPSGDFRRASSLGRERWSIESRTRRKDFTRRMLESPRRPCILLYSAAQMPWLQLPLGEQWDGAAKAAAGTSAPLCPSLGTPDAAGLAQRISSSKTIFVAWIRHVLLSPNVVCEYIVTNFIIAPVVQKSESGKDNHQTKWDTPTSRLLSKEPHGPLPEGARGYAIKRSQGRRPAWCRRRRR